MEGKPYIVFSTRFGDVQSALTVDPHITALSKLLDQFCNKVYSPHFDKFAPLGKIDGQSLAWGYEGCDGVKLYKNQRFATVDIIMPKNKWLNKTENEIRTFLTSYFEQALQLIVRQIQMEDYHIDDEQLFADFSLVKQNYLCV
ncbi:MULTISPECIES: hypothetical protein [Bacillus]|uniref:hypothetical protein n=1 Tax=Bacillus TaxID=1386 RepID=UPI00031D6C0D|nr:MULTISPECIES: hypothetical protein [Bacillus]